MQRKAGKTHKHTKKKKFFLRWGVHGGARPGFGDLGSVRAARRCSVPRRGREYDMTTTVVELLYYGSFLLTKIATTTTKRVCRFSYGRECVCLACS